MRLTSSTIASSLKSSFEYKNMVQLIKVDESINTIARETKRDRKVRRA